MLENVVLYGGTSVSAEMRVWSMNDTDTQGTVEGREKAGWNWVGEVWMV